ncbi:MAG: bifunctional demethylmenaquinone methyltransferase/2-methoxy-6-polyprenyl-1,4-benzoquinol methylase UbiE [Capsulimonadaceae bacterium]|nr:bifunctional demethylmenaquinone methyltransferase/2-methoxy-6-polyprenyl-1,4-benzoquinol methylase UbiE [Capsulimonadaceae bacterium]
MITGEMGGLEPSGIRVLDEPTEPGEKAEYVRRMFDEIAPRYDLLNDLLSFYIHGTWRSFAARCTALAPGDRVLDVCTGTGDFAVALRKRVGASGRVVGADFSAAMLEAGAAKFDAHGVERRQADATALPFDDGEFDAATVGFGIRNVDRPVAAIKEMARVVRPGGRVVILEFSQPSGIIKALYDLHSRWVLPAVGGLISGRTEAYTYLPESVKRWLTREEMAALMRNAGLERVRWIDLTFGIVSVHVGEKPADAQL